MVTGWALLGQQLVVHYAQQDPRTYESGPEKSLTRLNRKAEAMAAGEVY